MQREVRRIVFAVAGRSGRAALAQDRQQVILDCGHTEPVIAMRRGSILSRHTSPEAT